MSFHRSRKFAGHESSARINAPRDIPPGIPLQSYPRPVPFLMYPPSPGVTFACTVRTGMAARLQGLLGTYLDLNQSRAERAKAEEKRERKSERAPRGLSPVSVCTCVSPHRRGRYVIVTICAPLHCLADRFRSFRCQGSGCLISPNDFTKRGPVTPCTAADPRSVREGANLRVRMFSSTLRAAALPVLRGDRAYVLRTLLALSVQDCTSRAASLPETLRARGPNLYGDGLHWRVRGVLRAPQIVARVQARSANERTLAAASNIFSQFPTDSPGEGGGGR